MPDDAAPGWDALHGALAAAGVTEQPVHWGTGNLPDQDGSYALNAFPRERVWLLVTLGLSERPHWRVALLTVVGVTDHELERMRATSTRDVLEELRQASPLLVTDQAR